MQERPILFSGPMIPPILADRKTQTRRVVKPRKDRDVGCPLAPCELAGEINSGKYRNSVYGAPGDRLWVRETWQAWGEFDGMPANAISAEARSQLNYPADGNTWVSRQRPSIHMPRWASRITLEITGVRIERLQDISHADALAEGAPPSHPSIDQISLELGYADFSRSWFAQLWEQINGPGGWLANPWVWVVEFRRIRNVD